MKTLTTLTRISVGVLLTALGLSAQAGTLINNFTTPFDYVANGIIGDTNWDGVYLRFGDIPGGNIGGDPAGDTAIANTGSPYPGFLSLRSCGGDWDGAGDDGVFIWKLVPGDFDVSVQSSPFDLNGGTSFDNGANQMAGLMARAYNPDNSGSPYGTTTTNLAENYVMLLRFQEFGINEVNEATNGLRVQHTFPDGTSAADLAATRYFRIVRSALTNFTFYWKTNASDAWVQLTTFGEVPIPGGVLVRSDLTGPLQVGIAQSPFSADTHDAVFTDFELSGSSVSFPTMPTAVPSNIAISPVNTNSVSISWNTNGGDGSLVVVHANGSVIAQPIQGITYTANPNFHATNTFLSAGNNKVVYVGQATNVVVTGLGGSNNTYYVAVFTYTGSGASTLYNTASPATNSTIGPGRVASVSFTVSPTNIPVGGVALATVIATYDSGDSYDVSSDTSTVWTSSDPSKITVANGTLTGIAIGSSLVSANYAGVVGTTSVSVHAPAFTDDFSISHDFVALGLPGSQWDGLYLRPGDLPGANNGGSIMFASTNDINISGTDVLSLSAGGTDWEGAADDGYFLFKNVPGDFQAMVHITNLQHGAYQFVGLMARAANADGSPYLGSESHVNWWFFDQYGVVTSARSALNGAVDVFADQTGSTPVNTIWLLLQRVNGTNFYCFQKFNASDPWAFMPNATMVQPLFTNGVPLQVGLAQSTFTGSPAELVQFDNFMLDAANISSSTPPPPPAANFTMVSNPDLSLTLTWIATNSPGVPVQSMVVMRAGAPVSAQPPYGFLFSGNAVFGLGTSLGSGNFVVFRSANPPPSITNTVTVTGLSPGVTYYAAVYTFNGTSTTKVFNTVTPAELSVLNGTLVGIETVMPVGGIPVGGVATPVVYGVFTGGGLVPITPSVSVTSDNPTVVVVGTNGVLSGLAPGTTNVHFIYQTFTNTVIVTVRPPGFTENFAVNHDYVANGVTGSAWDGVYLGANSFPNQGGGNDGQTSDCDANTTLPNSLTVTGTLTDWAGGADDGFLLFKYVPGDFQAAVHITSLTKTINYLFAGLMARAFGTNGAASLVGTNNLENWVYLGEFDEFDDDVESRRALDGVDQEFPGGAGTNDWWLLMKRDAGTNFTFFKKLGATDPWIPLTSQNFTHPHMVPGVPVQVGLFSATYTPNTGTVQFDSFMLDSTGLIPLAVTFSGGSVIIMWPTAPGATLESTPTLSPPNWQPSGAVQHQTGDGYTYVTLTPGGMAFFRLIH